MDFEIAGKLPWLFVSAMNEAEVDLPEFVRERISLCVGESVGAV